MADSSMMWAPKSAWDGIAAPGRYGAGADTRAAVGQSMANGAGHGDTIGAGRGEAAGRSLLSPTEGSFSLAPGDDDAAVASAAGVTITLLPGRELATLGVSQPNHPAFAAAIAADFGINLPADPANIRPRHYAGRDGFELVWSGLDQWMAIHADPLLAYHLPGHLGGSAAIADQSGGRAMLTVSGLGARDCLAKGCSLDLNPRSFSPGDAAVTTIAHIGVMLWQTGDEPDYTLAVSRSMAGSFWSWLSASAAGFGYEVRTD